MISNLQHFALSVPDVDAGRRFYETFGLAAEARGNRLALRCAGREQDQILLGEGSGRRIHHLSFGTTVEGLASARRNLEQLGVRLLDAPGDGLPDGIWFRDPDGMLVNLQIAEAALARQEASNRLNTPGDFRRIGVRGAPARGQRT